MQAAANVIRQRQRLRIAENLNCFLRRVHQQVAVFAVLQVNFDGLLQTRVQFAVKITGKLAHHASTVHWAIPFRKYRFNFSRSFRRARSSRDFTAGTDNPRASAVSSVESSSMSRNWKTVLKGGSSSPITWESIPASSSWA